MARQNHGPLSRAKGKIGGVVYQQYEGMQISREYQPVVKNPQSELQVKNRGEFKLASQTVAVFKEVINARLGKLSIYTRIRRGAALQTLKRIITTDVNDNYALNFDGAIAAINAKSLTEYGAPSITVERTTFNVTAPAESKIIGVIAGFDEDNNYIGRKVVTGTGTNAAISFPAPADYAIAKAMFVYTVAPEEEGNAIYGNLEDAPGALALEIARLVSNGDLAVSDIAGETGNAA